MQFHLECLLLLHLRCINIHKLETSPYHSDAWEEEPQLYAARGDIKGDPGVDGANGADGAQGIQGTTGNLGRPVLLEHLSI